MSEEKRIRVLIVDDSFFMRKLIADLLESDSSIEVIGDAKDGAEAVEAVKRLKPDVVTMDLHMPEMDGISAIKTILSDDDYRPAIIMLSAHTTDGAEETLKGLSAGAVDFILKPSGELSFDIKYVQEELIEKIKIAAKANVQKIVKEPVAVSTAKIHKSCAGKIVVIGASTGGPPVIDRIVSSFAEDFCLAVLIVQHMPAKFTPSFASMLNKKAGISVKEAEEGEVIEPGVCLLIPGGSHGVVEIRKDGDLEEKIIHLNKELPVNGYRPSIDVLMKSVAEKYKNNTIGIILTGMGNDGMEGMRAIRNNGGYTIVQSLETAVITSMPNSVLSINCADEALSPGEIIEKLKSI